MKREINKTGKLLTVTSLKPENLGYNTGNNIQNIDNKFKKYNASRTFNTGSNLIHILQSNFEN